MVYTGPLNCFKCGVEMPVTNPTSLCPTCLPQTPGFSRMSSGLELVETLKTLGIEVPVEKAIEFWERHSRQNSCGWISGHTRVNHVYLAIKEFQEEAQQFQTFLDAKLPQWTPEDLKKFDLYIVRLYDGFDNQWVDVTGPLPLSEAHKVYSEKTEGGTKKTKFSDIDYYKIFPADTKMLYSGGFGERG